MGYSEGTSHSHVLTQSFPELGTPSGIPVCDNLAWKPVVCDHVMEKELRSFNCCYLRGRRNEESILGQLVYGNETIVVLAF